MILVLEFDGPVPEGAASGVPNGSVVVGGEFDDWSNLAWFATKKANKQTCETCRFWKLIGFVRGIKVARGDCRRRSPLPMSSEPKGEGGFAVIT